MATCSEKIQLADDHIPDEVLHNILARLPTKSIMRFRCVSTYWCALISDPYFVTLISRRMILLPYLPLRAIDGNEPVFVMAHSMVKLTSPFENNIEVFDLTIVGTFNGIVLLVLCDTLLHIHMILYNPFTRASKKIPNPPSLPNPPPPPHSDILSRFKSTYRYGFAKTPDDFKVVLLSEVNDDHNLYSCFVFSLEKSSWSTPKHFSFVRNFKYWNNNVGIFLNGFLHWMADDFVIMALHVEEMAFSEIHPPHGYFTFDMGTANLDDGSKTHRRINFGIILGELDGCLCMIIRRYHSKFDLLVMKEHGVKNSWLIACSFTLGLKVYRSFNNFYPVCVLEKGRILLATGSNQLMIYNTSNNSYKILELPERGLNCGVEYIETLVSPSDMCSVLRLE